MYSRYTREVNPFINMYKEYFENIQQNQRPFPFIRFEKCKFSRNIGRSRKAETSTYGRRLINKSSDTFFFVVFYLTSKYYIGSEKSRTNDLADQGPQTVQPIV